jgi:hypothetical protein
MEISLFASENNVPQVGQNQSSANIDPSKITPEVATLMEKIKDLPQEEQQAILAKVFDPKLQPEDINNMIKSGKAYQFTSVEEYSNFKKYKEEEEGHFLQDVAMGISSVPDIVGNAAAAYWNKPSETLKKTVPSVIEGLAQNGRDTYGMFWESNDPSSPFFRFKAALSGNGNTALEMYQLNDAIRFQKMSMDLAEGKTTWVMDKDLIDPKVTQLAATLVDPEIFIPYAGPVSLATGVARLAGFGEKMTSAAIRAQKIKSGVLGGTLKWGVGAPAEFIGNLAKNSIEHGVRMGAGVLENVAGVSGDDVVRVGRAAGVATASAHVAGYSLPYAGPLAATHLGGGLLAGFGQAVTETGNQILRSQGHRGSLGFARQALEDASKNGINFSKQGKMFARIIDTFDPAMSYAFHAAEGALVGGAIGAGFAFGSQGGDGVGQGIGFGIGAGAVGGLGGRAAAAASGSLRRMRNDIQGHFSISMIGETDKVSANDLIKTKSDPRANVEEIDAVNMTAHALASLEGTVHYRAFGGGVDSAREFAAWKQSRDGQGISVTNREFQRIEGFFVQRDTTDGALYIGVNLDNLYGSKGRDYAKHTLSHELLHAVLMASAVGPHFQAMGRDMLVGVRNAEGKLVQKGILSRTEFETFTGNYRDAEFAKAHWSKIPDGAEKQKLISEWFKNRDLVKSAMDKLDTEGQVGSQTNMTPEEVVALNKYTEEFLAYYFSGMMGEIKPEFFAKKGAVEGMDAVMDFIKNSWKDHWENRVMFHEPRFSFHKNNGGAIDAGFFDKDGKRVRVGAIDYFLKDMLKASMDIKSKGFIDLTRLTESTRARLLEIGANGVLIKDPKTGKVRPKTRRELASENAFKGSNGHKVLEAMDPALRRSQTGPDGVIRGDFSDAEFDALVQNGVLTHNEAQIGKLFQRTKDDPSIPNVFEFGYLGKSKQIEGGADNDRVTGDKVPVTNREVLLADFTVEFGADGHFAMRIRGLDMKVMKRRKALIWQNPSVRALWADDHRLLLEDFKAYLSNLSLPHNDANRVKTEVWLNQKYGDGLGDARRDVLHQISGFAKGQDLAYANTPIAIIPRGTLMAVTDFTVDSMMNLRTSGENFGYVHSNAFYDVARNFKPAAFKPHTGLGENEFYKNPIGYNILKSKGIFKVFSQTGEYIGNAENAKKAAALAESHFDTAIPKALQKAANKQNAEIAKFKYKVSDSEKALVRDEKIDIEDLTAIKALRNDGTQNGAHYQQEFYQEFLLRNTIESQKNPKIWEELLSTLTDKEDVFGTIWIRTTKSGIEVYDKSKNVYKSTTLQNRFSVSGNSKVEKRLINHAILMKFLMEFSGGDIANDKTINKPFVINAIHSSVSDEIINNGGLKNTQTNTGLTSLASSDGFVGFVGSSKSLLFPDGHIYEDGKTRGYGQMSFVAARLENAVLVNLKDEIKRFREFAKNLPEDDIRLVELNRKYGPNPFENLFAVDEYIASQYPNRPIIKISREPYFGSDTFGHESGISILIDSNTASDSTVYLGSNFKIQDGIRVPSDEAKDILSKRKGIEYNGFTKEAAEQWALRRAHQKDQTEENAPNSSIKLYKPANVDEYFRDTYVKELLETPSNMAAFEESVFEQAKLLMRVNNTMNLGDGEIRNLQAVANLIEAARRDVLSRPDLQAMTPEQYAANLNELENEYVRKKIELNKTRVELYQEHQYADAFNEFASAVSRANLGGLVANGNQDSLMYSHPYLHAAVENGVSNSMQRLSELIRHEMHLRERLRLLGNERKDLESMSDSNDRKLKSLTKNSESFKNCERDIEVTLGRIEIGKVQLSNELKVAKGLNNERLSSLLKSSFGDENFLQIEMINRESNWEKRMRQNISIDSPEELYRAFWIRTLGFGTADSDVGSASHAKYKDLFAETYDFLSSQQERATVTAGAELRTAIDWARENVGEQFRSVTDSGQRFIMGNWTAESEKRTSVIFTDVTNPFILMHNKIGTEITDVSSTWNNKSYRIYDNADDAVSFLQKPTTYTTYTETLNNRIETAYREAEIAAIEQQMAIAKSDARYLDFSEEYHRALSLYKSYSHESENSPILHDIGIKAKHDLLISETRSAIREKAESGIDSATNKLFETLSKRMHKSDNDTTSMLHSAISAYDTAKSSFNELDMRNMFISVLRNGMIETFAAHPNGMKAKEILRHIQLLTSKGIPVKAEADVIGLSKYLAELEEARRGKPNEKITVEEVLQYIDANSFDVYVIDRLGILNIQPSDDYILGNNRAGFGDIAGYGTAAAFVKTAPSIGNPERFYPSQGNTTPHAREGVDPRTNIVHTRYSFRKNTLDDILGVVEEIQANNAQHEQVKAIQEEKMLQDVLSKLDPISKAVIEKLKASIETASDSEFFNMAEVARLMVSATWNVNPSTLMTNGIAYSSAKNIAQTGTRTKGPENSLAIRTARRVLEMQLQHLDSEAKLHSTFYETIRDLFSATLSNFEDTGVIPSAALDSVDAKAQLIDKHLERAIYDAKNWEGDFYRDNWLEAIFAPRGSSTSAMSMAETNRTILIRNAFDLVRKNILTPEVTRKIFDTIYSTAIKEIIKTRGSYTSYLNFASEITAVRTNTKVLEEVEYIVKVAIKRAMDKGALSDITVGSLKEPVIERLVYSLLSSVSGSSRFAETNKRNHTSEGAYSRILDNLIQSIAHRCDIDVARAEIKGSLDGTINYKGSLNGQQEFDAKVLGQKTKIANYSGSNQYEHSHVWDNVSLVRRSRNHFRAISKAMEAYMGTGDLTLSHASAILSELNETTLFGSSRGASYASTERTDTGSVLAIERSAFHDDFIRNDALALMSYLRFSGLHAEQQGGLPSSFRTEFIEKFSENPRAAFEMIFEKVIGPDYKRLIPMLLQEKSAYSQRDHSARTDDDTKTNQKNAEKFIELGAELGIDSRVLKSLTDNIGKSDLSQRLSTFESMAHEISAIGVETKAAKDFVKEQIKALFLDQFLSPRKNEKRQMYAGLPFQPSSEHRLVGLRMMLRRAYLNGAKKVILLNPNLNASVSGLPHDKGRAMYEKIDYPMAKKEAKRLGLPYYDPQPVATLPEKVLASIPASTADEIRSMRTVALDSLTSRKDQTKKLVQKFRLDKTTNKVVADYTPEIQSLIEVYKKNHAEELAKHQEEPSYPVDSSTAFEEMTEPFLYADRNNPSSVDVNGKYLFTSEGDEPLQSIEKRITDGIGSAAGQNNKDIVARVLENYTAITQNSRLGRMSCVHHKGTMKALDFVDKILRIQKKQNVVELGIGQSWLQHVSRDENGLGRLESMSGPDRLAFNLKNIEDGILLLERAKESTDADVAPVLDMAIAWQKELLSISSYYAKLNSFDNASDGTSVVKPIDWIQSRTGVIDLETKSDKFLDEMDKGTAFYKPSVEGFGQETNAFHNKMVGDFASQNSKFAKGVKLYANVNSERGRAILEIQVFNKNGDSIDGISRSMYSAVIDEKTMAATIFPITEDTDSMHQKLARDETLMRLYAMGVSDIDEPSGSNLDKEPVKVQNLDELPESTVGKNIEKMKPVSGSPVASAKIKQRNPDYWTTTNTGDGMSLRTGDGYFISLMNNKYRVYNINRELLGIYSNEAEAKRKVEAYKSKGRKP